MRIHSLLKLALIFGVFILNQNIKAQTNYPNKPVKMIVAAATGGGTDILGRMFAVSYTHLTLPTNREV